MKNLELNRMENINGSIDCSSGLGLTAGVILTGFLFLTPAAPLGAALILAGGVGGFAAGSNCADNNWSD